MSIQVSLVTIDNANAVIAQANTQRPRTHGSGSIQTSKIDYFVESNEELRTHLMAEPNTIDNKIGRYVTDLIEDRSTLQMAIGSIPNTVL